MRNKRIIILMMVMAWCGNFFAQDPTGQASDFRAPAVPLITHDPYFSIWSGADKLTDTETIHWTGRNHPLHSIIRIDGVSYRVMGSRPSSLEPLSQSRVAINPTSTVYYFDNHKSIQHWHLAQENARHSFVRFFLLPPYLPG